MLCILHASLATRRLPAYSSRRFAPVLMASYPQVCFDFFRALFVALRSFDIGCLCFTISFQTRLLGQGASCDLVDGHGRTPLHLATSSSCIAPMCRLLVEKMTNPNVVDSFGRVPLHYAVAHDNSTHVVQHLLSIVRLREGVFLKHYHLLRVLWHAHSLHPSISCRDNLSRSLTRTG